MGIWDSFLSLDAGEIGGGGAGYFVKARCRVSSYIKEGKWVGRSSCKGRNFSLFYLFWTIVSFKLSHFFRVLLFPLSQVLVFSFGKIKFLLSIYITNWYIIINPCPKSQLCWVQLHEFCFNIPVYLHAMFVSHLVTDVKYNTRVTGHSVRDPIDTKQTCLSIKHKTRVDTLKFLSKPWHDQEFRDPLTSLTLSH